VKGNYSELARQTERYAISGSTERLIQAGEITEEEAKQMMIIQAEVDGMVEERRMSSQASPEEENYANGADYEHDDVMQQEDEDDSNAYSYSYGGNYRYQTEYDDDADEREEEEEEQQQRYQRYQQRRYDDNDEDEYQNKLD